MSGILAGIGVGPGDPDLLTLQAWKWLQTADLLLVPRAGKEGRSRALETVSPHLPGDTPVWTVALPMSGAEEEVRRAHRNLAVELIPRLSQGTCVGFLTLGDPSLYSTFGYLARAVTQESSRVKIQVVPGINSASAAAAAVHQPLAQAGQSLGILPAPVNAGELARFRGHLDNLILLKVGSQLPQICRSLPGLGWPNYWVARNLGRKDEKIWPTPEPENVNGRDYFTLVIAKGERTP